MSDTVSGEKSNRNPLAVYLEIADLDPAPGIERLRSAGFDVVETDLAGLAEHPAAVALLIGYDRVDESVLMQLPNLRVIATHSAGVDMVDLSACARRGVAVCNVVDAATEEVAVHALALALSLVRSIGPHDRSVRAGGWEPLEPVMMRRPSTLTCGVVGMGRIGRRFAELARPVFARIVGTDPHPAAVSWPEAVQRLELDELLKGSDVVSLHLPLTAGTEGLIDAGALARMPRGAYLVNVSRGALVDEAALAQALRTGHLAGAGLDVLAEEPPAPGLGLATLDAVLLTPHIGYLSLQSAADYVTTPADNVIAWLRDGTPANVVQDLRTAPPGSRSGARSAP